MFINLFESVRLISALASQTQLNPINYRKLSDYETKERGFNKMRNLAQSFCFRLDALKENLIKSIRI